MPLTVRVGRWAHTGLLIAMLGTGTPRCPAHADLEQQIAALTAQLATNATAELFLQRAELHRRHAEPAKAHADLDAAEKLKSGWSFALLARARTLLDEGKAQDGLRAAESFLQQEPAHPDGLVVRARCRVLLHENAAAIEDFSAAIAKLPAPMPDLILERARLQAALGRIDDAVAGIDEGQRKLGEIPSLQLPAIEYERQRGNFAGALARVDRLLARYPRKEPWLTLRAEVLEQAGRLDEARATFREAIAGIETYPPVRRQLDLIRQLETRARDGLARVEVKLKPLAAATTREGGR
jgi:tetratricopeptide (TPR) repeat protein